ncbi:hypothetical protein MMC18_008860 [Xylographa bjoerkii]|nr:hypothetical protein [Xylographa bjoerkii]
MDGFFANYPSFQHDRQAPLVQEFYRMCDQFEGKKDDDEKKDALSGFKTAMVHRLNTLCGTDVEDIESWRKPCLALDIMPPDGLQACRKARLLVVRGEVVGDLIGQAVRKLYINIGDLVDTQDSIGRVAICETLEEWRTYTIESGKCFPKQAAQAGGVLKFLLRQILNKHVNNTREGV